MNGYHAKKIHAAIRTAHETSVLAGKCYGQLFFVTGLTKHIVNGVFSLYRVVGTRYSALLGIRV